MVPVDLLNYQLIRLLGRGGMGEVYLARNKNIDQFVAVKALHPKYANSPVLRSRFKQEAVMLNSLNHPNIVKFLNFVENEYGVFLIMEYVDGYTLEEYINKKSGLIVEEKAYPMMMEILDAFSYAHKKGIIHRDIKPSNIFLNKDGHIKILDFGIAQIVSEVNKTQGGQSMGTPAYMSPEQVFGQNLDQRSDIYSLGVLFHQMLTGRAPYDSTTMSELEIKGLVAHEKLPRMKNYYPYISDGMQAVVDKATSKNPKERFASCDEMKAAIYKAMNPETKSRLPLYIGIAAALLCLCIGLGIWDYFRTKVSYYKDYVEYYGVAKGVDGLSGREVSHRVESYRIESSRWKVRRITLVNSKRKPIGHSDSERSSSRYSDVYYYYNDQGKLDYKKVYNEYGRLLYKIDYDENMKVAMFKHDDEHGTAKRLVSNTTGLVDVDESERSSITRYLLTYDKDGLLQRVEYASGEDNTPVGDSDNIYGQAYSYDKKGRITEVRFLGRDGKIKGNRIGLAIKQYEYDSHNNWTQVKYLSAASKPSHDGNNCSVVKLEYDKWGNCIAERYYMVDGVTPAYRSDVSTCGYEYEIDNKGCRVLLRCIDGNDEVINCQSGFAQVRMTYDDNAFRTMTEFLDKDGNRTYNTDEDGDVTSITKCTIDEKGLPTSISYFDTQEHPIETSKGMHKLGVQYDSVGNILQIQYYNKDGKLAHYGGFNSSERYVYDEQNMCQELTFYDEKGKLTLGESGFAKCQYTYDRIGNLTQIEFYGADGKTRVNSIEGYAVMKIAYDDLGNIKTIHHFNASMNPVVISDGYFAKEFVYEDKTNFNTQEKYYNAAGAVFKVEHYTYDPNGNITSTWTVNGAGALQGTVSRYEYDDNNRISKIYHTNLAGTKVNNPGTEYCETDMKYDARGNVIEQTYLDVNGKPACDELKTYKRIKKYDDRNNYVYEKNLGKDGKPLHGSNVNPEATVTYDEHGNITLIECQDGYGKPYTSTEGFHRLERKYNEHNLLASESYRDIKGNLVTHRSNGYAKVNYTYDSKRNITQEKYFASSGKMTNYATYTYNSRNSMTEFCMYNANGKLDDSQGFSKMVITYGADGVIPVKRTFYEAGKPVAWQNYNAKTGEWGDYHF